MELSKEDKIIQDQAIKEIINRKDELIEKFIISKRPLRLDVISFFMAGSPGAGKTEFSHRYMSNILDKKDPKLVKKLMKNGVDINSVDTLFIKIDADEIREFLSQYQKTNIEKGIKGNSHIIQKASNKGLDILRDYCFDNHISFLHDGTFGNFDTMRKIVNKSLKANRDVQIFYIYLDPLKAWEFTKAREYYEGRNIIKEKFIDQFFASRENVCKIKTEFGNKIKVHCVLKGDNTVEDIKIKYNILNLDNFIEEHYNKQIIKKYSLKDLHDLIS